MLNGDKSLYYGAAYKESLGLLLEGERISATQTYEVESISSGEEDWSVDQFMRFHFLTCLLQTNYVAIKTYQNIYMTIVRL